MALQLEELERELQALGLWQTESPTLKQLSSREPFSVDILTPQQWLQWIFIPKMGR
ncbi:YqcC family protein [Vibrio olivae]